MTASEMGRKGGRARMASLTAKQRKALAQKASLVRWSKRPKK